MILPSLVSFSLMTTHTIFYVIRHAHGSAATVPYRTSPTLFFHSSLDNFADTTCQQPAPPTHTKASFGLKEMIINCNVLRVHLVPLSFKFSLTFTNLISSLAVNQSLIQSFRSPILCSERTEIVMGEVCSRRLSLKSFARKSLTSKRIAKSSGDPLISVTEKLSIKHLLKCHQILRLKMFWNNFQIPLIVSSNPVIINLT